MIKQPYEMNFDSKKFSMILYGSPGVGKTTLALSAPNPILIDFDRGMSRVKSYHRKPTIVCENYEEVLHDIQLPEINEFETIVIDTGGSFITYLQDWAMRTNPAVNRQKNGTISLKGFGAVKSEFQRFSNMIRDVMNKNLIFVFHSNEEKDKDGNPQQRLLCEGAAKNIVWQPCDFGGYLQMIGTNRVISFTPTEEYFAKGCYGVEGSIPVPSIDASEKNDFLTKLFEKARENIKQENEIFAPMKEQYEETIREVKEIISKIRTADDANSAAEAIPELKHALTSKKESGVMLMNRAKELGFTWDKQNKKFIGTEVSEKVRKTKKAEKSEISEKGEA